MCREKWMASVVAYDHDKFEKVSKNNIKEMLIEESQKDAENYEDNADHSVKANNKEIKEADMLLATAIAPQQVQVSRGLGSQISMVVLQTSTESCSHTYRPRSNTSRSLQVCRVHEDLHNSWLSWCGSSKSSLDICYSILTIKLVGFNEE